TNWVVTVPLQSGTNQLNVTGIAHDGSVINGDSNSLSVVYNNTVTSPVGKIVLNEIMCAPQVSGAEYVELYNNSTDTSFDLSGWQLQGLGSTFPNGATLAPTNFLVLAANRAAFASAYGATNPVFDTFDGTLSPPGQTLTLSTSSNVVVTEVKYGSQLPWPTNS